MLTKCTKFMTQSLNCIFLYTVCFGILIVSLNTTFYHFFMYAGQRRDKPFLGSACNKLTKKIIKYINSILN